MGRQQEITKHITRAMRGIEIAPWHSPIAAKRDGYNCIVLDLFDAATLRRRAAEDPQVDRANIPRIEDVDVVGSAVDIGELVEARGELGQFDYVISSHNFEHLPNPIRFLHGCSRVLKPGGILSMAVPDKRGCFDYFRPHSTTADILEAFFENRTMPKLSQVFESSTLFARYGDERAIAFLLSADPRGVSADRVLEDSLASWRKKLADPSEYVDTHCWAFTPSSFCLIALELRHLQLSNFDLLDVLASGGAEFYAHLRNGPAATNNPGFYDQRHALLHNIQSELSVNSVSMFALRNNLRRS